MANGDYFGYAPDVEAANQIQAQIQANLKKEQEQHQGEINAIIEAKGETSAKQLAELMNTPTDYDAIWATIPEQYQKLVETPYSIGLKKAYGEDYIKNLGIELPKVKAHSAKYNPYTQGVKVSGEGTVSSTPSPTQSYGKDIASYKDGDQMIGDGTKGIPSKSIYIWIDNSWHYQGQAGDPNFVRKDQFVKNYYEQKNITEQATTAAIDAQTVPEYIPPTEYTPPSFSGWGYTSPWAVAPTVPLPINSVSSYNPNTSVPSWGYRSPWATIPLSTK